MFDASYEGLWADLVRHAPTDAMQDRALFLRRLARRDKSFLFPPPVFEPGVAEEVEQAGARIVDLVRSIPQRVFGGDWRAWADALGFADAERELILALRSDKMERLATHFARPDFVLSPSGPRICEVNVSAALGGMNEGFVFADAFRRSGLHGAMSEAGIEVDIRDTRQAWADAVMDVAPRSRSQACPVLFDAAVDAGDPGTARQHFRDLARAAGFTVIAGLMSELQIGDDGVSVGGIPVDLVFTMFTWWECRHFGSREQMLQLAALSERGLVDYLSPLITAIFDNKANLEFLSRPAWRHLFDASERAFLDRYVPETFRLTRDTLAEAIERRAELVVKPADEWAGRGVLFGHDIAADAWAPLLADRLAAGSFVCQKAIDLAVTRDVPFAGATHAYTMSLGPLLFGGRHAGLYVRQMGDVTGVPVLNAKLGAEAGYAYGRRR